MQRVARSTDVDTSVEKTALDWSAIGRMVREATLDAVSLHFAAIATEQGDRAVPGAAASLRDAR